MSFRINFGYAAALSAVLCLTAQSSAADNLSYVIKPKQVVAYTVSITVNTPTAVETMKGVIAYTGVSAAGDVLTLSYSGGLKKSSQSKAGSGGPGRGRFGGRFGGPPIPRGPFSQPDFRGLATSTNRLVVTQRGVVESMQSDSQLPYLLGNLSLMPFETLPATEQEQWQDASGVTITSGSTSNSRFGSRFGPFGDGNNEKTKMGGGESSDYKITNDDGRFVTIAKTYSLTSPAAAAEETGYSMAGTGTWVFNRELGVSESMNQTLNMVLNDSNTEVKYPITVKWNRMSDEQYAAHKKKVKEDLVAMQERVEKMKQDRAEKAAKAALLPPKPMNSFQKKHSMRQLNHSMWHDVKGHLFHLDVTGPSRLAKEDMDLATQVGVLRAHSHKDVRALAEKIWKKWEKSFVESASDEQQAKVAAVTNQDAVKDMVASNPFEEVTADDGKGQRTWADATGRFKIEAEFVKLEGATVTLKKKDGKLMKIPKARLCSADQKIIDKLAQ